MIYFTRIHRCWDEIHLGIQMINVFIFLNTCLVLDYINRANLD